MSSQYFDTNWKFLFDLKYLFSGIIELIVQLHNLFINQHTTYKLYANINYQITKLRRLSQ